MRKTLSWSLFFAISFVFVLTLICSQDVSIVAIPCGLCLICCAIVYDVCSDLFLVKGQVLKFFVYSLLGVQLGQVYELPIVMLVSVLFAVIFALFAIVVVARIMERISCEADKINQGLGL